MAQRLENPFASRFGENTGFEAQQKGAKPKNIKRITQRSRAALGQIDNTTAISEGPVSGKHVEEEHPSKTEGRRPRTLSIEPMETESPRRVLDKKDVEDIDAEDHGNAFACAEYAEEIYSYLKKRESLFRVPANYIKYHQQINERMRAILVDWLVQVHDKFRLLQETLFLTVSILDRYLAVDSKVAKGNLQLVGVTAMLLASKIEEIYTPEVRDFVYITDNAYSPTMITHQEKKMATALDYNFGDPLCLHFLRRNSKAAKADAEKHTLGKYFMELLLPDYESIAFPPSQRAAAALCLAMKITDNSPWNDTVQYYSQYTEQSLKPCMKKIAQLVIKSGNKQSKLLSVTNKYNRGKFFKVASSPCLLSPYITAIAQQ